jgi:Plavaka transposase
MLLGFNWQRSQYTWLILRPDHSRQRQDYGFSCHGGNNEYHPVYLSIGNIHNNMRRAHRDGVAVIAFLAIPKSEFL